MKQKILILLLITRFVSIGYSQSVVNNIGSYENFPLMLSVKFQNLALPFQDLKTNFKNIGVGLATEVSWGGSKSLVQQFNVMWVFNNASGNTLTFYSQAVYRPSLTGALHGGVKGGISYTFMFKPNPSLAFNGKEWVKGPSAKGMFGIPAGVHLSWQEPNRSAYSAPYVSYDLFLHSGFNRDVPVLPHTVLEIGNAIHFKPESHE